MALSFRRRLALAVYCCAPCQLLLSQLPVLQGQCPELVPLATGQLSLQDQSGPGLRHPLSLPLAVSLSLLTL